VSVSEPDLDGLWRQWVESEEVTNRKAKE
jgi:hypothetical protein